MRDGHAARPAAKIFDDIDPCFNRCPEVTDALGHVALEDVVGTNAHHQEFMVQLFHDLRIVIDALQEHHLIIDHAARVGDSGAGVEGLTGAFLGMVKMRMDEDGVVLAKHVREAVGNPLWKRDEISRPEPEDLDMVDRPKAGHDVFQPIVGV